jgi:hypothetical protein
MIAAHFVVGVNVHEGDTVYVDNSRSLLRNMTSQRWKLPRTSNNRPRPSQDQIQINQANGCRSGLAADFVSGPAMLGFMNGADVMIIGCQWTRRSICLATSFLPWPAL